MGGDTIGKVIILDLQDNDTLAFTEILAFLKKHHDFEWYSLGQETILSLPGLEIHMDKRKVYRNNQEIKLTVKEYKILCFLVANRNCVLTYEQIYQRVWGEDVIGNESNAVGCHVRNLRKKLLQAAPDSPFNLQFVRQYMQFLSHSRRSHSRRGKNSILLLFLKYKI